MKARILLALFALPFAAVGAWMAWSVGSTLYSAWQMSDWVTTEAHLSAGGYETSSGDSDTYEAYAKYTYTWNGRTYTGNRVGIASGADNIGDYQQETGRELQRAADSGQPVTVYVDAEDPSQSILDPGIRWWLIGFKMIFVVVFGGVGFGLLIGVFMAEPEKDSSDPAFADTPWLLNDDWQTNEIRSGSRSARMVLSTT